jgi:histidine triad (HIT) family protein
METIFSKIIAGAIPCDKIYEDERVFAFLDINPVNPGHALVVPKAWSKGLLDAESANLQSLITVVQKVAKAVKEATGAAGVNIIQNDGAAAGQKVDHLHFHVIPRHEGDGFEHWHGKPYANNEVPKALAEKIQMLI